MAVAFAQLTNGGSGTNLSSYGTASITPTADALVLCVVAHTKSGTPEVPTLSGNGLTWVLVDACLFDQSGTQGNLHLYRALGASPSAGAITIDYGGVEQAGTAWVVYEATGVDTGGTNGSAAVVQTAASAEPASATTSVTATLGSAITAGNAAFAALGLNVDETVTADTDWTIGTKGSHAGPTTLVQAQYKVASDDNAATFSWTTSIQGGAIIVEVKAAGSGATTVVVPVATATASAPTSTQRLTINVPVATAAAAAPVPAITQRFNVVVPVATAIGRTTSQYSNLILNTPGLAAYWRLGEPSGTTAEDSGPNNLDLTYRNTPGLATASLLTTDADTSVDFDGATHYADRDPHASLQGGSALTVECWFNADAFGINVAVGLYGSTTDKGYWLSIQSVPRFLFSNNGSTQFQAQSSVAVTVGTTHHLVGTYDGETALLYLDGILVATNSAQPSGDFWTVTTASGFAIGRLGTVGNYVDGRVDEVAIYNAVLDITTIADHYRAGASAIVAVKVPVPVSTSTAEAPVPSVLTPGVTTTIDVPVATATASAPTPTITITAQVPTATATGTAPTPTIRLKVQVPVSTATALSNVPNVFQGAPGLVTGTSGIAARITGTTDYAARITGESGVVERVTGTMGASDRITGDSGVGPRITGTSGIA